MMESLKILCKIDQNLETRSEFKGIGLTKPNLVAYIANNNDVLEPAKKILYFKMPQRQSYPINLNLGFRSYTERQSLSSKAALQCTLQYNMSPQFKESVDETKQSKIKVFTRRGTLVDLMESCYSFNKYSEFLVIRVTRFNGDLYMIRERNEPNMQLTEKDTHESQLLKNVFNDSLNKEPNIWLPFDANKTLMGVHRCSIKNFELIYSGPIYGIKADEEIKDFNDLKSLNDCCFVMAKQMWHSVSNDPGKHLNYYLQAYLANVNDLYLAYKDSDGIVREPIVHKRVSDISDEYQLHWKRRRCTAFLYNFLQEVNKLMSKDDVNSFNTVYEFHVHGRDHTIHYKIFKDNPEMILVTPEYVNYCQ